MQPRYNECVTFQQRGFRSTKNITAGVQQCQMVNRTKLFHLLLPAHQHLINAYTVHNIVSVRKLFHCFCLSIPFPFFTPLHTWASVSTLPAAILRPFILSSELPLLIVVFVPVVCSEWGTERLQRLSEEIFDTSDLLVSTASRVWR